jgi:lipopolysaccharide export system protein LptA
MNCRDLLATGLFQGSLLFMLLLPAPAVEALESDRQQPLDVYADMTDGTLGDGMAILRGNVEINQGTLQVRADVAEVEKAEGRVRLVTLTGNPVHLQQEIEEQGLVTAEAQKIVYEVGSGIITLTGSADVVHPQYHIKGELLKYDMKLEHFQGSGGDGNGRIRIQLDPEVVPDVNRGLEPSNATEQVPDEDPGQEPDTGTPRTEGSGQADAES